MKNYFKILLKNRSEYAAECLKENFIGAEDYGVNADLEAYLSDDIEEFKNLFFPIYLAANPGKRREADRVSEILWTYCKGMRNGDVVVCPNGRGTLYFGEIISDYYYRVDDILPHRRGVKWFDKTFKRDDINESVNKSLLAGDPTLKITQHAMEIERYIREGDPFPAHKPLTKERLLEDFLVENWEHTELGKLYDIFEEDGEMVGQQYPAGADSIDILAESKDKKELLVIELKRGKASYAVVGQILNYMGFVQKELAEKKGQLVKGIIIASENDKRVQSALLNMPNVKFLRYQVSLKLIEDKDA